MTLADFTSPGLIVPELEGPDVAGVIQELCRALQREGRIPDLLPFYHAALNRELLVNGSQEAGLALPHARLPGVTDLTLAFGRCRTPMVWHPQSAQPVSLVFLAAVPATESSRYLTLCSGVARLARDPALLEALHRARDVAQIHAVFQRVPLGSDASSRTRLASASSLFS